MAVAFASIMTLPAALAFGASDSISSCEKPRIVVDSGLDAKWHQAVSELCSALGSMRDVDLSASLRIVDSGEGSVVVAASLGDGRVAERRVVSPNDLRATVEALVILPPSPERQKPEEPSTDSGSAKPVARQPTEERGRPSGEKSARSVGIEVGASAIGRVWGSPTYLSAGGNLYAGLRPGNWLFALLVRWDPVETLSGVAPPAFEMESVGAGFVVARRFGTGPQFDVGATASFIEEIQSTEDQGGETSDSQTDMRLGALLRTLLGHDAWRASLSLEADVSPGRLRRSVRIAPVLPDLPSWSVGVGIGATWEDR